MSAFIDLTGRIFGKWTALRRVANIRERAAWLCRCECGTEREVSGKKLRRGNSRSCGCSRNLNLVGEMFGRLTVLQDMGQRAKNGVRYYLCKCICGKEKIINASNMITGDSTSCGCYQSDVQRKRPHEYAYNKMLVRATKRAVEVALSYENYLLFTKVSSCHYCDANIPWSEHRVIGGSHGYHLDRKDNNSGYSKENCVVCCSDCNITKRNLYTYEEFMLLAPVLKQIRINRLQPL